ncbi:MAG: hypothetical protein NTY53_26105, partial [Kiritimatiellaeota bacterium]|nr:hypothetical protein [Kiritimatiellota bacterium]
MLVLAFCYGFVGTISTACDYRPTLEHGTNSAHSPRFAVVVVAVSSAVLPVFIPAAFLCSVARLKCASAGGSCQ